MSLSKYDNAFLSRDSFSGLKGYLTIIILFHHLYQFTGFVSNSYLGQFFNQLGHFAIIGFIFISGYGLLVSYESKKEKYLKYFPLKRLYPFLLSYALSVLMYYMFEISNGNEITVGQIMGSFLFGNTIISFGWYLHLVLWVYFLFFVIFSIVKSDSLKSILVCILCISYCILSFINGSPIERCTPIISLLLGFLCGYYKECFSNLIYKTRYFAFIPAIIGCIISYKISYSINNSVIVLFSTIISDICIIFIIMNASIFCNQFAKKILINPVSFFMCRFSLEIYICQGLIFRFFASRIQTVWKYSLATICSILAFAICFHFISSFAFRSKMSEEV